MRTTLKELGLAYETVAASVTGQVLGSVGSKGDFLRGLLVTPATTTPGAVTIIDGATSIIVFAGGTLLEPLPFYIDLGVASASGAWSITTGASLSVVAVGNFT
jgi:hypothetical protein